MPIHNKDRNRARQQQAGFIPKPKNVWWGPSNGDPEAMGLHQLQKGNSKATKKGKRKK